MAREHLSEELKAAGLSFLQAADEIGLSPQGAMWIRSHALQDWRYYLVSSLVDTAGRRKAYQLLIRAFEVGEFPKSMTIEDVHLGSPNDPLFQKISRVLEVDNAIANIGLFQYEDLSLSVIIYRSMKAPPSEREARAVEKRFERTLREKERA